MKVQTTTDYQTIARLNRTVHDLHARLYPEYFKSYHPNEASNFFKLMMKKENILFFLLEDGGEAVGYAMIELCRQPESSLRCRHDSIYIHQFCIVEGKQKKGYGTYFMEEIERFAKSLGFEWLELDYWAKNEGAEKFYDQFGFEPVRTYVRKRLTD